MDKTLLREILSIPTYSYREELIREYIERHANDKGYHVREDLIGNLYLSKGDVAPHEHFPCVVAHMDTVHRHIELIDTNSRLIINEGLIDNETILTATHPITKEQTGIGGDDKCGIYICLELMDKLDKCKAVFFMGEEIGMVGSSQVNEEFFGDVGYAIQFDAPGDKELPLTCSGVKLWDDAFIDNVKPILEEYDVIGHQVRPFTDVVQLKQKFDFICPDISCGYHNMHTSKEYVVVEEVEKMSSMGYEIIKKLGNNKHYMRNVI